MTNMRAKVKTQISPGDKTHMRTSEDRALLKKLSDRKMYV